ncbi:MAG: citrate synthase [Myxococcales bacterium]|nr:citrate synthase [Myxococcales bacterium]
MQARGRAPSDTVAVQDPTRRPTHVHSDTLNRDPANAPAGLDGVVVAETRLSEVDGAAGRLTIAGYPVEQLASGARHERIIRALWRDATTLDEDAIAAALRSQRALPDATMTLLGHARAAAPIDALLAGLASLGLARDEHDERDEVALALRVVAQLPAVVATHWRLRQGLAPVSPDPALDQAGNFLYMLDGTRPSDARARALETYLNTVVEHGMNASTFTARVITSTRSDLISAVVGALGALKGPLHGGAPGPVLDMIDAIEDPARARDELRARLASGERLMGFGHRVYRVRDPRAEVLAEAARQLAERGEQRALFERARAIELAALEVLREHKPGRVLETNVEFYTALLLHAVGVPRELFTSVFAVGRVVGWLAHCFEQRAHGRLLRPRARYVGPRYDREAAREAG